MHVLVNICRTTFLVSANIAVSRLTILRVIFSIAILVLSFPLSIVTSEFCEGRIMIDNMFFAVLFCPLYVRSPSVLTLIFSRVFCTVNVYYVSKTVRK